MEQINRETPGAKDRMMHAIVNISAFRVRFAIKKSFALQAYHSNNYKFIPANPKIFHSQSHAR